MIWFKNLKGSPSVEFCGCVLSVFSREQVSNIVLILVKFKLCPMVRGEGTRWLVTALILVEGGERSYSSEESDGKMWDFGQIAPD